MPYYVCEKFVSTKTGIWKCYLAQELNGEEILKSIQIFGKKNGSKVRYVPTASGTFDDQFILGEPFDGVVDL